jgi:sugar phosphate isomerase/epimerase
MAIPFALQLYTVRDHLEKDFRDTLKRVKEIGYDFVETAGFTGQTAADAREIMESVGIIPVSAHVGYQDTVERPETVVETANALGVSYVATGIHFDGGGTREDWIGAGKALDLSGAKLRAAGIQLCYHNHAHEFIQLDGEYAYDVMMTTADPANLQAQIDTYWVKDAGLDPVTVINQYAGRCPLLHIKDMTAGTPHTFAEVGQGIIDWAPIFAAGEAAGAQWFIVEQDTCAEDSLESARISAEYMRENT